MTAPARGGTVRLPGDLVAAERAELTRCTRADLIVRAAALPGHRITEASRLSSEALIDLIIWTKHDRRRPVA
jgi:hypothetical protein